MKKLLSPSDKSNRKGNALLSAITMSVVMMLACAVCLTGATWAWWTANASVQTVEIVTAYYETELVVTYVDSEGNTVVFEPDENGQYNFEKNVRYTATITASGNASTGFATFKVEGTEYHSIQIAPGDSISFDILNYLTLEEGEANWGTSSADDNVFDGDLRFIRTAVKLVPKDENSTAMIERDGVVETYNTDLAATPVGVTEIKEANEYDTYDADSYETYYVYGLKANITEEEIADYVRVTGDGYYEVELNNTGKAGTGAIIAVYDKNGTEDQSDDILVEKFYIIIFGDIDGDTDISTNDTSRLNTEIRTRDWSGDSQIKYLVKAADLDLDTDISTNDLARLNSAIRLTIEIDQKTGLAS